MRQIKVYTSPVCSYCHRAKELLAQHGKGFDEIDITHNTKEAMRAAKGAGSYQVPILEVITDGKSTFISGFHKERYLEAIK